MKIIYHSIIIFYTIFFIITKCIKTKSFCIFSVKNLNIYMKDLDNELMGYLNYGFAILSNNCFFTGQALVYTPRYNKKMVTLRKNKLNQHRLPYAKFVTNMLKFLKSPIV